MSQALWEKQAPSRVHKPAEPAKPVEAYKAKPVKKAAKKKR